MTLDFDAVDWYRMVIVLAVSYALPVLTWRYLLSLKDISPAQRLYIGALLLMLVALVIGSVESVVHHDGWRWRLIPSSVAIMLLFAYLMEPLEQARKRWGREPYDPKGPGEL